VEAFRTSPRPRVESYCRCAWYPLSLHPVLPDIRFLSCGKLSGLVLRLLFSPTPVDSPGAGIFLQDPGLPFNFMPLVVLRRPSCFTSITLKGHLNARRFGLCRRFSCFLGPHAPFSTRRPFLALFPLMAQGPASPVQARFLLFPRLSVTPCRPRTRVVCGVEVTNGLVLS